MTYATLNPISTLDFLDLEIEPGLPVRNLASAAECEAALMKIDLEIENIIAQIGRSEAEPGSRPPGWRTRAQGAIRWKKRTRLAITKHAKTFSVPRPTVDDKRQAILTTIQAELGEDEFERMVALAKSRHPHLPWGNP